MNKSFMCYLEEALPLACQKTWENADITPGVCLLTFMKKKSRWSACSAMITGSTGTGLRCSFQIHSENREPGQES